MEAVDIEIHDPHLCQIGLNSIIDFYRTLARSEHQFPGAIAFIAGMDSPFFNVLFDTRSSRLISKDLVVAATDYFGEHQVPWGWFIMPADRNNDLPEHHFSLLEEYPAMYFNLSSPLPIRKSEHITIREVDMNDDLSEWIQPINDGFQVNAGDDSYRKLNVRILYKGENKLRHFVAFYKGEIAGASTLFISHDAVMLHNLATKSEFTKHGVGTTLTLHMMELAKNIGFEHCFLDASSDAFSLYRKVGFKVYCSTLVYSKT